MIYLLLSVLSSSLIPVIFKLFTKWKINTLQAIIFNYFIACAAGFAIDGENWEPSKIHEQSWFLGVIVLGFLFIAMFYLAALTTQKHGLSVVSVATKMSVAIPVLFGILLYDESTGFVKILGIILALVAVYLSSLKDAKGLSFKKEYLILPIIVFIGSGIVDTGLKFLETTYVNQADVALFTASIFAVAGIVGLGVLLVQKFKGVLTFKVKNLMGGILLGIPNFGSIYFLVLALRGEGMESSTIFPVNNVAIVLISTCFGIFFFKERMLVKNWIGIALAIASIILIASSQEWM